MNFFQKLFTKAVSKALRLTPKFTRWAFQKFDWFKAVEGYEANSAVFSCVSALAFSFPEAPLLAGTEKDGKFTANYADPIMDLLLQPNPDMGEAEFMQYCVTYAAIGGNCYIWKQRNANGGVLAWWPFSDAQMKPIPGDDTSQGLVKHYEYNAGPGVETLIIPKDDIIHWKWMPNLRQPWRGMGGIQAAASEVDKDQEANAYIYALLKNNAVPPIVITLTEDDELTPDKARRLRKEWAISHSGENAGSPAFLEYGMKAEKLGYDLQQLAGEALSSVPEARIAACLRVPPVVAGLSVGLKRSDYGDQAARRSFTELTLAALWRMLASELRNGMKDEYPAKPKNWRLAFNLRVVRALQDDETKVWERVTSAFERSLLTRAQAKTQLGIEPDAGDDVYKISLASEFVPVGETVIRATAIPAKRIAYMETKARNVAANMRSMRAKLARTMQTELDTYFSNLADQVVERAKAQKSILPSADSLLTNEDATTLTGLIKRFYVAILELSWEAWNLELGIQVAFDLKDPLVTAILALAGTQVKDIQQTTLDALREALQKASDAGLSIDDLVRGDTDLGIRALRDIVDELYKNRARTIARTELGTAQNSAAAKRYAAMGVDKVIIMDNGADDDDEACKVANGQIWSLSYFEQHVLEHPNCTRAPGAYFGDDEPVR